MAESYEAPRVIELGSIAEFTRGDRFAWKFDGSNLAEIVSNMHEHGHAIGEFGTS